MKIIAKEYIPKCRYVDIHICYDYIKQDGRLIQIRNGKAYVHYLSHYHGNIIYTSPIRPLDEIMKITKRRIKKLRRLNII